MTSRWLRVLVAAELVGIVALVLVGVHLGFRAAHAVGDVVGWTRPHAAASPAPAVSLPATRAGPAPGSGPPAAPTTPGPGLFDALNRDAARAAAVQRQTLLELEAAIRDQLLAAVARSQGR